MLGESKTKRKSPDYTLPLVVNVKVAHLRKENPRYETLRAWMADKDNEYVGRGRILDNYTFPESGSIWANPFKSPRDGTLEQVLDKYEKHIRDLMFNGRISRQQLIDLSNKKRIGCWCVADPVEYGKEEKIICHAQVLQKLMKEIIY